MRRLSLFTLCAGLVGCFLSPQPAHAQQWTDGECTVSLWWPYSRDPGDCLTDAERLGGGTGTFRDPDGALMLSAVAHMALRNLEGCDAVSGPEPLLGGISERLILEGGAGARITLTGTNFRCNSQAYFNAVPMPTNVLSATQLQMTVPMELARLEDNFPIVVRNRAPIVQRAGGNQSVPTALADPSAPASMSPGQVLTNERGCTTSILWPYVRDDGDCLTEAEREGGLVGVYGNSRMAGDPPPDPSTISPLPASSDSGGIFGLFGDGSNFGGGGLLDDNLLPAE